MSLSQPNSIPNYHNQPAIGEDQGRSDPPRVEKVLVADDDSNFRELLVESLEGWGYEVILARNGMQAWHILQMDHAPRIAILDWNMPGLEGPEICKKLRELGKEPYTYIILLTVNDDEEHVISGLGAGADDYVTKPYYPHELRARINTGERILNIQRELIVAREALRIQATRDSVTQSWNRGAILDILDQELDRATRDQQSVGVIMADLDHFKQINDVYGHLAGDAVLLETSNLMRSLLRNYDSVGRYGGDEFLIVLPNCNIQDCVDSAERICVSLSSAPIITDEGAIKTTLSLGVAASECIDNPDRQTLIRTADEALYEAKRNERNSVGGSPHKPSEPVNS
jgi:two-component system, cell cycle response regulator